MTSIKITKEMARKVIATVNAGLCSGMGDPEPGHMCVEAAVCYALGLPHGDDPPCVSPVLRRIKIILNDHESWASNKDRAAGLIKLSLLQLGTDRGFNSRTFIRNVLQCTGKVDSVGVSRLWGYSLYLSGSCIPTEHTAVYAAKALLCSKDDNPLAAAREIERILIDMNVPGVKWLHLLESEGTPS